MERVVRHIFWLIVMGLCCGDALALMVTDSGGHRIVIATPPQRVVSLVPSITEALFAMGAGDRVVGVTLHDTWPPEAGSKAVVGGFLRPSVEAVRLLNPDLVFASAIQQEAMGKLAGVATVVQVDPSSVDGAFAQMLWVGRIMGCETAAQKIVADNRRTLDEIAKKVAKIPASRRKRVLRLMGPSGRMTPGADSFPQELIRMAGGIAHGVGRDGGVISLTDAEFLSFSPDVMYGCGDDPSAAEALFNNPRFQSVPAVKNRRFDTYPCELTCRASTHTGYFVSWLAATLYPEAFSVRDDQIHPDGVVSRVSVPVALGYVKNADIARTALYDFPAKTLVVQFTTPKAILSTLDGWRDAVTTVGNSYVPPQCWRLMHDGGFDGIKADLLKILGAKPEAASFLFTGADMDNYSLKTATYREMSVTVLATAGVCANAMRMGKDSGDYYEPGTINLIILPNMRLSKRAMSRAIISATEGKTAALQDLDVRSSYTPRINPATGTGTDNTLVVEGEGTPLDNAGGHTKMGELIAKGVYDAVTEAIFKQNGLTANRNVFRRLKERKISLSGLIGGSACPCNAGSMKKEGKGAAREMENLLLEPRYAAFIETAMALSDAVQRGLVTDLSAYKGWCMALAREIAGGPVPEVNFISDTTIPVPLAMALNALLTGIEYNHGGLPSAARG